MMQLETRQKKFTTKATSKSHFALNSKIETSSVQNLVHSCRVSVADSASMIEVSEQDAHRSAR